MSQATFLAAPRLAAPSLGGLVRVPRARACASCVCRSRALALPPRLCLCLPPLPVIPSACLSLSTNLRPSPSAGPRLRVRGQVWNTNTGEELLTLEGHKNVVYAIAFNNPFGDKILTGTPRLGHCAAGAHAVAQARTQTGRHALPLAGSARSGTHAGAALARGRRRACVASLRVRPRGPSRRGPSVTPSLARVTPHRLQAPSTRRPSSGTRRPASCCTRCAGTRPKSCASRLTRTASSSRRARWTPQQR